MAGVSEDLSEILGVGEPALLVGGGATEGPLWHPGGYLTFVRLEASQLVRWDPDGTVVVIRESTGRANGCTLDRRGDLLMCEAGNRRVTRLRSDGSLTTVAERWQGRRLNRPNDVVCRSDGTIYFTDPGLFVPSEERDLDFSGLFRVAPDGELELATDDCEYPNGLAFSPDESILYVAITRLDERCLEEAERGEVCTHRRIRAFDVGPDGSLTNNRLFADLSSAARGGPDGIKVDSEGRIYCASGGGIWVFDATGERLGIIPVPETPRNLAFGGPDMGTMYITAGDSVYGVTANVRGIGAY